MGSTDLDALVEAGASAAVADIDNILSLIRAHVHGNGTGNGNGNGSMQMPQSSNTVEKLESPAGVEEALMAQAQFNHDLMGTLRLLGEQFVALQNELALLQEQQRAGGERIQESLTNIQSHSVGVDQEVIRLKQELAGLEQSLASERESSRRQHFEQVRQVAQLEERVRQINTLLLATGRRVDGVASRAHSTEQSLDGVRERVADALAGTSELKSAVARVDARTLDLEQRLGRTADEMTQHWGDELSQRDENYREQLASLRTALDSMGAWFNQEFSTAQERQQSELNAVRELVATQSQADEDMTGLLKADLSDRMGTLEQRVEVLGAQGTSLKEQYDHRFDELVMRLLRAERAAARDIEPVKPCDPLQFRGCEGSSPTSLAQPSQGLTAQGSATLSEPGAESHQDAVPRNPDPPLDYFMFSLQHRGSVASVRARQAAYIDLFCGRKQVLDLGCGRGEFLELISGNGAHAIGVDSNRDMIDFGREHGLEVVQADLFEYLRSLPDTGLDGIFSAQVIEHLSPDQIRMLIRLCGQKLGPDGLLVLETVNPLCPFALTNFWLDPTHVRPVLPKLLTFMLEEAGFGLKALRFNSPVEGSAAAPSLETVNEWPAALDQYQDYAAIAGKSSR